MCTIIGLWYNYIPFTIVPAPEMNELQRTKIFHQLINRHMFLFSESVEHPLDCTLITIVERNYAQYVLIQWHIIAVRYCLHQN